MTDSPRKLLELVLDGPVRDVPEGAVRAKRCECDPPVTYRNEDGELRCICGRGVGP